MMILKNALNVLKNASVIHCEIQLNQIYENASLFPEVDLFLRDQGWELMDIHHLHRYSYISNSALLTPDKVSWGDFVYFKSSCDNKSNAQVRNIQAAIALIIYNKVSLADRLLNGDKESVSHG